MKYFFILTWVFSTFVFGQDLTELNAKIDRSKPGESRFLLRGYAHSGFEKIGEESSFVGGSFNPIFLWRQSERLLFESELELELESGQTILALEYANMSYMLNDKLTIRLGMFLLPFGTFSERLHPRWINRLPSSPLGFGHDPVGPMRDMGVELRGNVALGSRGLNYAFYITNGPSLNDGTDQNLEADEMGMLKYNNYEDNNTGKAVGGRIGVFPLSTPSLELGVSGQVAKVGNRETLFEDVSAQLYALDLSYVNNVRPLKGVIDIKGQINGIQVDDAVYTSREDSSLYNFSNQSQASYLQATYRPAFLRNRVIKNLEFVGRYSAMSTPNAAPWETQQTQYVIGVNYWLDWRTVIKIAYQVTNEVASTDATGEEDHDKGSGNAILLHWAFGF